MLKIICLALVSINAVSGTTDQGINAKFQGLAG